MKTEMSDSRRRGRSELETERSSLANNVAIFFYVAGLTLSGWLCSECSKRSQSAQKFEQPSEVEILPAPFMPSEGQDQGDKYEVSPDTFDLASFGAEIRISFSV